MSRKLKASVAQLGPIHLADTRSQVVKRLMAMMREAHAAGARLVVFPELALTTFFPRYWMTDQKEIDRFFEREIRGLKPARSSSSRSSSGSGSISAMPS